MTTKVFVDGQEGTTGLRINEYLAKRNDVQVLKIDAEKRKDAAARRELLNDADVVFLCLPDSASKESVTMVDNPNTLVIDASTAFRTHADWAYGLPELRPSQRDAIRKSKRVAVPGCHATAFVLPLRPLISAEILPPNTPIHSFSITGYSGGGKKMIAEYEQAAQGGGNHKFTSPRQYALGLMHKHLPEMKAHTGLANVPIFTPVVSNFYKGLAVTTYLHPQIIGTTLADIQSCIANYYANEPLIRVLPLGEENTDNGYFDVQACNDTNRVDIFVFGNDERAILIARLDNLGKGASGAAVQCMNVHLGLDDGYCI